MRARHVDGASEVSLTSRIEYQVVPMPVVKGPFSGTVSFAPWNPPCDMVALEALLNAKYAEGWTTYQPIDFTAPALLFSRTHRRDLDEQVAEVLERLEDLEVWAPGLDDVPDDVEEPARSRLIKAVLAVWY